MASLYQTTQRARKYVIIILLITIALIGYDTYNKFKVSNIFTPPTQLRFYMDANFSLGVIPDPKISGLLLEQDTDPKFTLEGVFSNSGVDVAYVYTIDQPRERLLTFENAQKGVGVLGFEKNDFSKINENLFHWEVNDKSKTLEYDKNALTWDLKTSYIDNVNAIKKKNLSTTTDTYASGSLSFMKKMQFNGLGLSDGQVTVKYTKLGVDGVFVEVTRVDDAEYVFVNVFRRLIVADLKPTSEMPDVEDKTLIPETAEGLVYKSDPKQGSLSMMVSNKMSDYEKDIFELTFTDFIYSKKGSYLIMSQDDAWTKVQQGKGFLVSLVPQGGNEFLDYSNSKLQVKEFIAEASRTTLGYWEPEVWDGYVYPIYVFRGRAVLSDGRLADFVFYVSALSSLK